jgi:hypothetical protein
MMDVSEVEFQGHMVAGLARAQQRVGPKGLAFAMDLSTKQLGNILAGGSTSPKRLWDALGACPTALDDIAAAYGRRLVPKDAVHDTDRGTQPIAALLAQVAAAESPDSPGGTAKTHAELIEMEPDIRAVRRLLDGWIEEIDRIRAPRVVTG